MDMAGRMLDPTPQHVSDIGLAGGIANWLQAVPDLKARGLDPLPGGETEAITRLATTGLESLNRADQRAVPMPVRPALWTAFLARQVLTSARRDPARVIDGKLAPGPIRRALILAGTKTSWRV
jgi:hypothetical protein